MLSLRIAARFLKSSKAQTSLIIIGIAVGVAVQVFVGILIGSLQTTLIDRTIGNQSQVTIVSTTDNGQIAQWEQLVQKAEKVPKVTVVSPSADGPASLLDGSKIYPVQVRGLSLSKADSIYGFQSAVYQGRMPSVKGEVIIGRELNEEITVSPGDKLQLEIPRIGPRNVTVVGFFDLNIASLNKAWLVTNLETTQDLFQMGQNITSIEMQVSDVFKADTVAKDVETAIANDKVDVLDWKTQNAQLLSGLQSQSISSYMIQTFVLVSVVIAIGSVLAIKVVQKSREIGILKAMGIKDGAAGMIFLWQGLILGIAGAVLGIIIGVGLLASFTTFAKGADGNPVIDITFDMTFILGSCMVAILASAFAASLPARKTSRLSPIEVIRNG